MRKIVIQERCRDVDLPASSLSLLTYQPTLHCSRPLPYSIYIPLHFS